MLPHYRCLMWILEFCIWHEPRSKFYTHVEVACIMHSYHISVSIHYYSFPQLVKSKSVEVHMETKKRIVSFQLQAQALLLVMMMVASPIMSCPPTDGRGCKDCIVNQMKNACPPNWCMSKCKCSCVNYHLPHQIITLSIIILITRFGSTTML